MVETLFGSGELLFSVLHITKTFNTSLSSQNFSGKVDFQNIKVMCSSQ